MLTSSLMNRRLPLFVGAVAAAQGVGAVVAMGRDELAFGSAARALLEIAVSLGLLGCGILLLNQLVARAAARRVLNGLLAGLYTALIATTLTLGHAPDAGVLIEHADLLAYPSSYVILAGAMQKRVALGGLVFLALLVVCERRFGLLTAGWPVSRPTRAAALLAVYLALVVACWTVPIRTLDAPSRLLVSTLHFFTPPAGANPDLEPRSVAFEPTYPDPRRPVVFLVMLESYSALWLDRTTADGQPIAPVVRDLRQEGLWVEHFYANSIHSSRAYSSTLCSVLPSLVHPIVSHFPDLRLRCLPEVLGEHGYETYFFANSTGLERHHLGQFLRQAGIGHPFSLDEGLVDRMRDADFLWGFDETLQDDVFFERVFARLDAEMERGAFGHERPAFVGMSTGSHHMWFDWPPRSERQIYPDATDPEKVFAASLHTSDRYLRSLFDELARRPWATDALVVLVGDHSYPAGEHGIFANAVGAFEEHFRTPLVIWSPGWIEPRAIRGRAYSQVDLMPTILDLLGVRNEAPMAGRSIFAPPSARPTLMLQPYDGRQLVSVEYPYKLVRRLDEGRERLYHLGTDPREENDLLSGPGAADFEPRAAVMGEAFRRFFDNQMRLRLDAVLPR